MKKQNRNLFAGVVLFSAAFALLYSCSEEKSTPKDESSENEFIKSIRNTSQFDSLLNSSGRRLLVFDLYADWCGPCKILDPILKDVAEQQAQKASFYKVDVDKHPQIAQSLEVRGIPYVVFVKDREVVHTITGVQPRNAYLEAVEKHQ
ncbi:MAG: thioredoxin family protein [Chitinispirillaceae bacterium]